MAFIQSGSAFLSQAGSSVYEPKTYAISTANSYLNPLMNVNAIVTSSAVNVPLQSVYWSISNVTSNINSYNFIGNALSGQLNMSGTMDYASNILTLSANASQFVTGQQIFKVNILNAPGGTIMASTANIAFLGVPSAVTAVSAVANTVVSGKAAVTFSAPLDDGGNIIIRYNIISIPDNITVTSVSTGTVNVTGLTGDTPYTFVVTATNSIGTGANSAPSNQVTPLSPQGQQIYKVAGTYSFVTPAGLRRVSVVAVGGGGGGGNAGSGGSTTGGDSYFNAPNVVKGGGASSSGGAYTGDGGGNGGNGGSGFAYAPGGGGGAGGYSGDGGRGSTITSNYYHPNTGYLYWIGGSTAGAGGGGGGGGSKLGDSYCSQYGGWNYCQYGSIVAGSAGGGVSVFGQGSGGGAGALGPSPGGGGGGSGGAAGGNFRYPGGSGTCICAGGTAPSYPWGGNPGGYYPYTNNYSVPSNPTGSGTGGPNGYPSPRSIGGGGGGGFGGGGSAAVCSGGPGGGGGLGYKNAYPVTPGTPYTVVVGSGGAGGYYDIAGRGGSGGAGAVRLIWGTGRAFPTTSTTDAPVIP